MRFALALATVAVLAGCSNDGQPASSYRSWKDRVAVATGLSGFTWPCMIKTHQTEYVAAYEQLPLDQCYRMQPPKRWKGLWRNQFEYSRFCPAPATECSGKSPGDRIWLDAGIKPLHGLYSVEFIGRRTAVKGRYEKSYEHELIVDRMIAVKRVMIKP